VYGSQDVYVEQDKHLPFTKPYFQGDVLSGSASAKQEDFKKTKHVGKFFDILGDIKQQCGHCFESISCSKALLGE